LLRETALRVNQDKALQAAKDAAGIGHLPDEPDEISRNIDEASGEEYKDIAVWRMNRRVDLPWQSTNKRSLETVMFRDNTGLLEMAVCCAKPPYAFPY
jgi:hypothetical protein